MDSHSNEVVVDLSPVLKIYKDGRIERLWITPRVPPSLEDPTTGISSKEIIISPNVSARLYLPNQLLENQEAKLPIFVYCHGGGFCAESAFEEVEHNFMNILTSEASVLAVAVEYRLAPEHPLPAAYEDLWTALQWVCSHADNNGQHFGTQMDAWLIHHGDFGKVILGGDSAGANLVHNIAVRAAIHYVEAVKKSGWNGEVELVDVEGEMHCLQIGLPTKLKSEPTRPDPNRK
ncbi:deacetylase [Lithospermum erythrorhizon]|uniref:Deacetylase n=1 Tax=Lithospermum erythrorhizon TaxID=34254 RepID=A0AAV3NKU4_LITER